VISTNFRIADQKQEFERQRGCVSEIFRGLVEFGGAISYPYAN